MSWYGPGAPAPMDFSHVCRPAYDPAPTFRMDYHPPQTCGIQNYGAFEYKPLKYEPLPPPVYEPPPPLAYERPKYFDALLTQPDCTSSLYGNSLLSERPMSWADKLVERSVDPLALFEPNFRRSKNGSGYGVQPIEPTVLGGDYHDTFRVNKYGDIDGGHTTFRLPGYKTKRMDW